MKKVLSILLWTPPHERSTGSTSAVHATAQNAALKIDHTISPEEREIPAELLRTIAAWSYCLSPIVAYDSPPAIFQRALGKKQDPRFTGINLDVTGCDRLFGGDALLLQRAEQGLAALLSSPPSFAGASFSKTSLPGIRFRCALAPSIGAAWAFSRYGSFRHNGTYRSGRSFLVNRSAIRDAIAPFPLTALRLTPATLNALAEVELKRVEELFSIPRSSILARFGQEPLLQLDRALGVVEEPLAPIPFVPSLQESFVFAGPVSAQESLREALRSTLTRLCSRLARETLRARAITLELHARDLGVQRKELILAQATVKNEHLFTLFAPHLEKMNMGNGVDRLKLLVSCTERSRPQMIAHPLSSEAVEEDEHHEKLAEIVDVLSEHLGSHRVRALTTSESYIPERSFAFTPLNECPNDFYAATCLPAVPGRERPSLLFPQPRMIRALSTVPAGAPLQIEWRNHRYRVLQGIGPERIAPEWWGTDPELCRTRDYFKILLAPSAAMTSLLDSPFPRQDLASSLSGCWLWVFRQLEDGQWFIHGIWA